MHMYVDVKRLDNVSALSNPGTGLGLTPLFQADACPRGNIHSKQTERMRKQTNKN